MGVRVLRRSFDTRRAFVATSPNDRLFGPEELRAEGLLHVCGVVLGRGPNSDAVMVFLLRDRGVHDLLPRGNAVVVDQGSLTLSSSIVPKVAL